jgi:hypothetical protein
MKYVTRGGGGGEDEMRERQREGERESERERERERETNREAYHAVYSRESYQSSHLTLTHSIPLDSFYSIPRFISF